MILQNKGNNHKCTNQLRNKQNIYIYIQIRTIAKFNIDENLLWEVARGRSTLRGTQSYPYDSLYREKKYEMGK